MKRVIIVEEDASFKGTWYRTGQIFNVEDKDAEPPHLPGYYQVVDSTNTIKKTHCIVFA